MNIESQFSVAGYGVIVTGSERARARLRRGDGRARRARHAARRRPGARCERDRPSSRRGARRARAVVDVTDHPALDRAIDEAAETYGRLDVAFANAGIDSGPGFLGAWTGNSRQIGRAHV